MDPLTLCLKRQRTGYATVTTPCQPSSVFASLSLSLSRLCVRVCVRGMRVVARGVETRRRTLLGRGTGAVKGSNFLDPCDSIFYFPIFLYFFALLSYCCICEIMSRIFLY